jgi:hypothetical protein
VGILQAGVLVDAFGMAWIGFFGTAKTPRTPRFFWGAYELRKALNKRKGGAVPFRIIRIIRG